MEPRFTLWLGGVLLLHILSWNVSTAYVSADDCDETGAHSYHGHSQQSSSSSSRYTQTHPSPSGYRATSSSYMRTGSTGYGNTANAVTSGAYADGDLQTAQSVFSPSVTESGYQVANTGGYGLYRRHNEESSSYTARSPSYVASNTGYGASNAGYAASNAGYGASNSGYGTSSDSQVRQKFERLKSEADAFVHRGAPPPAGSIGSIPIGSHQSGSSISSQVHQASSQSSRYGSSGNVLGVTYGTTGTEEDDNTQKLIPVVVPAAGGGVVGTHKESADSSISYSTSGVATPTDGVDFSISRNTPLSAHTSSSQSFEALKQKAEAFVHQGGPPPTSSGHVIDNAALTQQSTRVETLPVRHTDRNTLIVPVRVTVTREHTVLPDAQQGYEQRGGLSSGQSSSYSSSSQSSSTGSVGAVNTASQPSFGSSSSYSYNAEAAKVPPKVYTVGPAGTISFPESNSLVEASTTSYGSTYSKQTSSVHQEKVVVPGAVQIVNEEEAQRRSNKLFDLVSGYGTFLPAKEEETAESSSQSSYTSGQAATGSSQSGYTSGPTADVNGYQTGGNGYQTVQTGFNQGANGYQGVNQGSYQGINGGYASGYQSGVSESAQSSQDYQTRVTGGGGGSYTTRTSGVYQGAPVGAGYSATTSTGYQVPVPAGTVRKTTVYSSYNSNLNVPTHIGPGIPVGDPVTPPEVSGSYFATGGAGKQYSSNYAQSYGTSAGYSGGYGRGGSSQGYGSSGYAKDTQGYASSGYAKDTQGYASSGYAKDTQGYGSGGAYGSASSKDSQYTKAYGLNSGYAGDTIPVLCDSVVCESSNIIPGSTGKVSKYGISSSWSSKSQTVNGKTTESKQAQVTVNDNGKVDTYATHTR